MKNNPERRPKDLLLDALLRDEEWETTSTAMKSRALETFRARQQARALVRWTFGAVACAAVIAVIAGVTHWSSNTAGSRPVATMASSPATPSRASAPRYLTDKELLASFPKGSCFLAEVDGKEELIFVDRNLERKYMTSPQRVSQ